MPLFGGKEKEPPPPKPLEQQIWEAAAAQDALKIERLCMECHVRGDYTSEALNWADASGRTPLMVAAMRNDSACTKVLIKFGADVHACNPAVDATGGTALHEATRNRHEALAELLLSNGANPFQCNAVGKTCMDEAVRAGSVYLIKRYEQMALANCEIAIKVAKSLGLRQEWRVFRLVAFSCTLFARPEPGYAVVKGPKTRLQMWLYKQGESMLPLARNVWLDNAEVDRFSPVDMTLGAQPGRRTDAWHGMRRVPHAAVLQKLDPNHEPFPGEFVTAKAEAGRTTLFIRSADGTKATCQALDQLCGVVKGQITMSLEQQQALAAGAAPVPPLPPAAAAAAAAALAGDAAFAPGHLYHSMLLPPSSGGSALYPHHAGVPAAAYQTHSVPNLVPAGGVHALLRPALTGADGVAAVGPAGGQQQALEAIAAAGAGVAAAGAALGAAAAAAAAALHPQQAPSSPYHPYSAAAAAPGTPPPPLSGAMRSSGNRYSGDAAAPDPLTPTHMWGGHSVLLPPPHPSATAAAAGHPSFLSSHAGPTASAGSLPLPMPNKAALLSDEQLAQYQPMPGFASVPAPTTPAAGKLSEEQLAQYQPPVPQEGGGAALLSDEQLAQYQPMPPPKDAYAMAELAGALPYGPPGGGEGDGGEGLGGAGSSGGDGAAGGGAGGLVRAAGVRVSAGGEALVVAVAPAPAPVKGPMLQVTASMRDDDLGEDGACVVCLSRPREAGFLHGETVHQCVCKSCSAAFRAPGALCPLCRAPVERIIASVF